ncbi:MAG: nucleotidyl transferase AbiEii/AbiGii toxin family protein [Ferruginibacter sp.]|nr:nucleotidyl transferase AbiEii/AbiGii toxin family protein [Ferruginibacter sp.]
MLHTQTVKPHTFSLLKELMQLPSLSHFGLVGGTALSLLYGHRMSEDLDIFSSAPFENTTVINELKKKFEYRFVVEEKPPRFGIFCFIDNIKVDIVHHPHQQIKPVINMDGIRMFSIEDIIAMKIQAVLGRGKKKDFWDIAELLQHFTVADFIKYHTEKYSTQNLLITVPQAITYFSDAEESEAPVSLKQQNWDSVQKFISKKVSEYLE